MMPRVSTIICRALLGATSFSAGLTLFDIGPAVAWTSGTGPHGGAVAVGPRGAAAVGPQGGAAAVGRGGRAAAVGPYGGAAVAGPRGAAAAGPYGGGAAVAGRPGYPAYRPPVAAVPAVPVYPGYARPVAPVGGAVAAGVVAGATAGAVARATTPPPVVAVPAPSATMVVAPPPPGSPLAIGTTLAVLPSGCTTQQAGSVTYYRCGPAWLRPFMEGPNVAYLVVPAP